MVEIMAWALCLSGCTAPSLERLISELWKHSREGLSGFVLLLFFLLFFVLVSGRVQSQTEPNPSSCVRDSLKQHLDRRWWDPCRRIWVYFSSRTRSSLKQLLARSKSSDVNYSMSVYGGESDTSLSEKHFEHWHSMLTPGNCHVSLELAKSTRRQKKTNKKANRIESSVNKIAST